MFKKKTSMCAKKFQYIVEHIEKRIEYIKKNHYIKKNIHHVLK